jgi:hypothetical protein
VEGKAGIADPGWTVLSPTNTATGITMSFCIGRPTPYQFFQVVEVAAGTPTPSPVVNECVHQPDTEHHGQQPLS